MREQRGRGDCAQIVSKVPKAMVEEVAVEESV
jgi:hypothetical protein